MLDSFSLPSTESPSSSRKPFPETGPESLRSPRPVDPIEDIAAATNIDPVFLEGVPTEVLETMGDILDDNAALAKRIQVLEAGQSNLTAAKLSRENTSRILRVAMEDLLQENYSLNQQLNRDPLTELLNLRGAETAFNYIKKMCGELKETGEELDVTAVFLDLDDFGPINKKFGDRYGDEALIRVSEVIRSTLRESDILAHTGEESPVNTSDTSENSGSLEESKSAARKGGDEFMLILPGSSPEEAVAVVNRLRAKIQKITFGEPDSQDFVRLGVSAGIAELDLSAADLNSAIQAADTAMRQAKGLEGKNHTLVSEPSPSAVV